ncbi:hypothetical protein FRC00_001915 [Tulasnella sp. 408]|nr:hypothetical protein FRC00_001915 [Tulasnella sp. 408]
MSATCDLSSSSDNESSSRSDSPANAHPNTSIFEGGRFEDEFDLLGGDDIEEGPTHEIITAPLITRDAFVFGEGLLKAVPQYGVLGSILSVNAQGRKEEFADKRMYLNTNAPFSAVVCGVQGSGKSHTVGVLLESMMIPHDTRLGVLQKPLSGLVLHFGESGAGAQPCEAAYQCTSTDPKVKPPNVVVYVSPSQLRTMGNLYGSVFGNKVKVLPLKIEHDELDAQSILSMMSTMLRDLGEAFNYTDFKRRLDIKALDFNPSQAAGYKQRISLLESFVTKDKTSSRFKAGQLTIIDLTDPFIDRAGACSLFEIVTKLFIRAKVDSGKVLVVDEAHKTGQAIVLAPGGLGVFNKPGSDPEKLEQYVTTFGRRYLLLKTRKRVTADGGASVLAIGHSP